MSSVIKAKVSHLRAMRSRNTNAALCIPGARRIADECGLDWETFIREGLPVEELEATGNAFCVELAAEARKQAAQEGEA